MPEGNFQNTPVKEKTKLQKLREAEIREQIVSDQEGRPLAWRPKKLLEKFGDRVMAGTSALGIEGYDTSAPIRITEKKDRFSNNSLPGRFGAGRALVRLLAALNPERKLDTHNIIKTALTHGKKVVTVDENYLKANKDELAHYEADGLVTNLGVDKVILFVANADCPSITVFAPDVNAVGLGHCGWKGLKAGMVTELIQKIHTEYGADISKLHFVVSPNAGELEYEVGEDVYHDFTSQDSKFAQAFIEKAAKDDEKKFSFNLNKIIELEALKAGIDPASLEVSRLSTIESDFFASYRRQGSSRSTNVSLAGLLK